METDIFLKQLEIDYLYLYAFMRIVGTDYYNAYLKWSQKRSESREAHTAAINLITFAPEHTKI